MKKLIVLIAVGLILQSCGGKKQVLSSTQNTSIFLPVQIEENVDMFVVEVDGKSTKFSLSDSVVIDEGEHNVLLKLEYQPAAGSSLIVGSLGNILLRAATNKTFITEMTISVVRNQEYRFVVPVVENGFKIELINETLGTTEMQHTFELRDGELTRIF